MSAQVMKLWDAATPFILDGIAYVVVFCFLAVLTLLILGILMWMLTRIVHGVIPNILPRVRPLKEDHILVIQLLVVLSVLSFYIYLGADVVGAVIGLFLTFVVCVFGAVFIWHFLQKILSYFQVPRYFDPVLDLIKALKPERRPLWQNEVLYARALASGSRDKFRDELQKFGLSEDQIDEIVKKYYKEP